METQPKDSSSQSIAAVPGKGAALRNLVSRTAGICNRIGVFFVLIMMVFTTLDVFLRYVFNSPVPGVFELTEFMMLIVVGFALAYTQLTKHNISVEIVASRFPLRVQSALDVFSYLLGLGVFAVIAWQTILSGNVQVTRHITSGTLGLPLQYFYYILSFSCILLCVVYVVDIFDSALKVVKR